MGDGSCVRSSLIAVNVLFLLGGLAILGLGIWVQVEKGDYVALADSDTGLTGAILLIAVGCVTSLISVVGFIGAFKRSSCILWIFFSVLMLILIVQIIALILGMVYREKVEDELHDDMKKTIQEYMTDIEGVTKAWDWAQQKFECCGVDNYTDWRKSITKFNQQGRHDIVPDSCCRVESDKCGDFSTSSNPGKPPGDVNQEKIYTDGCFTELKQFIKDHLLTIGLAALFFLIVELFVIILTVILAKSVAGGSGVV
ncbi:CD151 antigen-like isoform X2 [Dendronephthya gigantea]|uniref:CD151 antigen-like isoform X2 n=1 Tax=Dendronephthya gigantea TaxID=151771 RepID=UPI00106A8FD5|nr:CD151 antigen-like isoform X2 [Dendronephthya gigantea]XP_028409452.1 CD151 antigen-like isoform X2 [Dendronephthya gigantea]